MSKAKTHPHEKLDITFPEYITLLGVRDALALGTIEHEAGDADDSSSEDMACKVGKRHVFNMALPGAVNTHCGSVGCIGGYMALAMGKNMDDYVSNKFYDGIGRSYHSAALHGLFYPPHHVDYSEVTAKQALKAITRFLDGKDPWAFRGLPLEQE
jgi:hypothetical protein